MSAPGDGEDGASVAPPAGGPLLIVRPPAARLKNAPVCVNSHHLTREIAPFEDARLAQPLARIDEDHVARLFRVLMAASPVAAATDADRARLVLCRLLLGPVAVPCYADDWDADDYLVRCAYRCRGPALYVRRARCRCATAAAAAAELPSGGGLGAVVGAAVTVTAAAGGAVGTAESSPTPTVTVTATATATAAAAALGGDAAGGTLFTVLHDHHTTHVYRGLLSLAEWNVGLPDVFCPCNVFRSDRYVMAVLPRRYGLFLDYYPYLLVCLARHLTVPEMDECADGMTAHLGPQIAARVAVHYKLLFGAHARMLRTPDAGRANYHLFLLELQKLWLGVSYHNPTTRDFFEVVFGAFHRDTGRVMLALRTPPRVPLVLDPWLTTAAATVATAAARSPVQTLAGAAQGGAREAEGRHDQRGRQRRRHGLGTAAAAERAERQQRGAQQDAWGGQARRERGEGGVRVRRFSLSRVKRQILYFELRVRHAKSRRGDEGRNVLLYRRHAVIFAEGDVVWRNLFYIYYSEGGAAAAAAAAAARSGARGLHSEAATGAAVGSGASSLFCVARSAGGAAVKRSAAPSGGPRSEAPETAAEVAARGEARGDVGIPAHTAAGVAAASDVAGCHGTGVAGLSVAAQRYVRAVERLCLVRLRHHRGGRGGFAFDGPRVLGRHRAAGLAASSPPRDDWDEDAGEGALDGASAFPSGDEGEGGGGSGGESVFSPGAVAARRVVGGREFAEMTAVSLNRVAVSAFNTNRVINLKATVARRSRLAAFPTPRNMTHSFVMYKHTYKEPPFTVSTFVSNDAASTNSLNINIRGSYLEFLYALVVYRLYVNVENFFLPAAVCNSNSSLDVHGLEDQGLIRSERNRVYWTTNFPCMISNTNDINVGWFKAATAIIPKVSGVALECVLLKELAYVVSIDQLRVDYALHRAFTVLETRNCYQIPFLSKQFVLFLRVMLLRACGLQRRPAVDRLLFRAVRAGVFDYHKNVVAHAKIKHTCALVGTRLANNVPKVLVRNKKHKLDYLGRNANLLTVCRHIDQSGLDGPRLSALLDALDCLEGLTSTERTREALARARARLRGFLRPPVAPPPPLPPPAPSTGHGRDRSACPAAAAACPAGARERFSNPRP